MDKPEIAQVFLDETTKLLKHNQKLNKVKEFMALAPDLCAPIGLK